MLPIRAPAANDKFGFSVAVSGNVAVAGAPGRLGETGIAYSFNAATGALIATLNNPTPDTSESFGRSVAVSGDVAVVGAYQDDDAGATDAGSVGVFSATTGALAATLNNPAPEANDEFGNSVAVSGTVLVVGAQVDDAGGFNLGSAYTYSCTPPTPSPSPSATPSSTPTATPTATATASPTASPTATRSATPTASPTRSATPTASPTPSASPSATASPTVSPSPRPNVASGWELYE